MNLIVKRGVAASASTGATSETAPTGAVEVTLDPSELELEPEAVAARYERHLREHRPKAHEDLSDMLADHVARQKVQYIFYLHLLLSCKHSRNLTCPRYPNNKIKKVHYGSYLLNTKDN